MKRLSHVITFNQRTSPNTGWMKAQLCLHSASVSAREFTKCMFVADNIKEKVYNRNVILKTSNSTNTTHHDPISLNPSEEFVFDQKATIYAQELLADEEDIGEEVKVIKLSQTLQPNEMCSPYLVTRECSRALWLEVYKHTKRPFTHAVVTGTPGIGKSRSMMYLLRLLLKDNKTVFYETRKINVLYAFIPTFSGYIVKSKPSTRLMYWEPLLRNPDNYLLIDTDVPSMIPHVDAHTVVVCSSNRAHYREFAKRDLTAKFFMSPWSRQEIGKLASFMQNTSSAEELDNLFDIFGGVPRLLFQGASIKQLEKSINLMDVQTICNLINDEDSLDRQANVDRLSSMLFCYETKEPFGEDQTSARFVSEYVRFKISSKYWSEIMNRLNSSSHLFGHNQLALGRLFENTIASALLKSGGTFKRKNLATLEIDTITLTKAKVVQVRHWSNYVSYVGKMEKQTSVQERHLVKPVAENQPVVAFADACNRAYQITISTNHPISAAHIEKLLQAAGLDKNNRLHLYFVIPEHMLDQYQAQTFKGNKELKEYVSECVEQYAIAIPQTAPSDFVWEEPAQA